MVVFSTTINTGNHLHTRRGGSPETEAKTHDVTGDSEVASSLRVTSSFSSIFGVGDWSAGTGGEVARSGEKKR